MKAMVKGKLNYAMLEVVAKLLEVARDQLAKFVSAAKDAKKDNATNLDVGRVSWAVIMLDDIGETLLDVAKYLANEEE